MSGALQAAVIAALKADDGVRAIFGTPPRIYDDETAAPARPYARLERHEVTDRSAALVNGADHRLSIGILSDHGGLADAKEALSALKRVIEAERVDVPGHVVVLQQVTYADTMRRADRRAFRGVLRIRIILEKDEEAA